MLGYGSRDALRLAREGVLRRVGFQAQVARATAGESGAGGDHQQLARLEDRSQCFDGVALVSPVLGELGHVVVAEGEVDHGIHAGCSAPQAVEILEGTAMDLGTRCFQLLCAGFAAGEAAHLIARDDEFLDQFGSDETCCSGYKYPHLNVSLCCLRAKRRSAASMLVVLLGYEAEAISGYMISGDGLRLQKFCEDCSMPKPSAAEKVVRRPRVDAQRNRERILRGCARGFYRVRGGRYAGRDCTPGGDWAGHALPALSYA